MIYIVDNAVAILAATLVALLVGAGYRRLVGGDASGRGTARRLPALGSTIATVLALAWFVAILAGALILAPAKAAPWTMAIGTAVVIWAGFVAPATVVTLLARSVGTAGIARDAGWWLVVMVAAAGVLHAIGLTAPPG